MTRESKSQKNQFKLNGGLNTEINELNFPDGYTRDETNYELLPDGSRRRRKGLAQETGGSAKTVDVYDDEFQQTFIWRNVGGDPTLDVVVLRIGRYLYFSEAQETLSNGWHADKVDMSSYRTAGGGITQFDNVAISFSHGRGRLLVSGQYLSPFYVEYDGSNYTSTEIDLKIRDFSTLNDGTLVDNEPTGTITADHLYNLANRGWNKTDRDQFFSDLAKHPGRNSRWFRGYERYGNTQLGATNIHSDDLPKRWSAGSLKIDAEVFGFTSAPTGALFLAPFDTTRGYSAGGSSWIDISTWTVADTSAGTWVVTITTASAHGISSGDPIQIDGNQFYYSVIGVGGDLYGSLDGNHTATTGTTGSTIVVNITTGIVGFLSFLNQYLAEGQVDVASLARSTGTAHNDSLRAVEWYAGRAFYGGMANSEFADMIFFSQIVDSEEKYGKCYQQADPTDEKFNSIVATDGGHIVVPGLAGVTEMKVLNNSLLIFSDDGVYEITGSGRNIFTAEQHSVRKITEEGSSSGTSIVKVEDSIIYTGPGGIYAIGPNQYTGILEARNIITSTIQTKWNTIATSAQKDCQAIYDDSQKKIYFLVRSLHTDSHASLGLAEYDEILIFDTKLAAWSRYTFSAAGLLTAAALPDADSPATNKKAKFFYESAATTVSIADFDQTSFDDWDGTNGPLPYLLTGHDSMRDFQRRGQAPIITVFSKRTETGYTESGSGWAGDNPSSTLMSARWDWSDDSVSNKLGATQEVYRHVRNFVPSGASDVDGYPVVTTRNKVRGRGRALQLKFEGATDKDSHILGFTVNTATTRKK